jgi:protein-L-isoaspartate(D-aspartate) O-methyltransferase
MAVDGFEAARFRMVASQIVARGVADPRVLRAMREVPREAFTPTCLQDQAFDDNPLPLGLGQTLSQPYIVAFMAEALELRSGDRILDVGAGSGYAAAVLARLGREVFALELRSALAATAEVNLRNLGTRNVHLRCGDGAAGWPEAAPFDAIHVACAAQEVPAALTDQLAEGGRLILPLGEPFGSQWLVRFRKHGQALLREVLLPVAFVPMR